MYWPRLLAYCFVHQLAVTFEGSRQEFFPRAAQGWTCNLDADPPSPALFEWMWCGRWGQVRDFGSKVNICSIVSVLKVNISLLCLCFIDVRNSSTAFGWLLLLVSISVHTHFPKLKGSETRAQKVGSGSLSFLRPCVSFQQALLSSSGHQPHPLRTEIWAKASAECHGFLCHPGQWPSEA